MSYLQYNGKYVTQNNKLVLNIEAPPEVIKVIDFAGDDYISFTSSPIADLDPDGSISFNFYLDQDSGYTENALLNLKQDGSEFIGAFLVDSSLYFQGYNFVDGHRTRAIDISGRDSEILELGVQFDSFFVTSITLNGVPVSFNTANYTTVSSANPISIGSTGAGRYLENATIWDVKLYDSANAQIHGWNGTGANANTDVAWTDDVSTRDGTVVGSPAIREIPVP